MFLYLEKRKNKNITEPNLKYPIERKNSTPGFGEDKDQIKSNRKRLQI